MKTIPASNLVILRQLTPDLIPMMEPFQLLTHYLSASYGYYILGESVWDDHDYDLLCKRLLEVFDDFEHRHKHLTDKDALRAGTGFHIKEQDYPPQVSLGFGAYVRNLNSGELSWAIRQRHEVGEERFLQELQARFNR